MLGGGYYLHNIALPIMKKSANPKKNLLNLFLGYSIVFLSYVVCGVMGYFGFSSIKFKENPLTQSILPNCLLMFSPSDILATIVRGCTFLQILAGMCLMFACQRSQILLFLYGGDTERAEK